MITILGTKRNRRTPGTGHIYRRGNVWWIQFRKDGHQFNESTHSDNEGEAKRQLTKRLGEIADDRFVIPPKKVTIADLINLVIEDYEFNERADLKNMKARAEKNIRPELGKTLAHTFTTAAAKRYIKKRRSQGASNATINRETSIIRHGFNLGAQQDPPLVLRVPKIPKLRKTTYVKVFWSPSTVPYPS